MLTLQSQKKIVSKIVRLADGRVALAHFLVWVENGEIKGQILSLRTQDGEVTNLKGDNETLCLAGEVKRGEVNFTVKDWYDSPILSPYFSELILVTQAPRAPSL